MKTEIDNYKLLEEIYKTEKESIYLGLDTFSNQLVSIKIFPKNALKNKEKFKRERFKKT